MRAKTYAFQMQKMWFYGVKRGIFEYKKQQIRRNLLIVSAPHNRKIPAYLKAYINLLVSIASIWNEAP